MNIKRGFTLIELLGVLILLAVIALITFPIIDKVLSNAKNEAYERQKDSIIEAARMYVTSNGNYSTNQTQLNFQTLIDAGFLKEGEIIDPRDSSKNMTGCVLYNWSESKNQYMFEYSEECVLPDYEIGDLLKVQVSDNETQNIYVLEVNGSEIVGILDRNLGDPVEWINKEDYNAAGGNYDTDSVQTTTQNFYKFGSITANKVLNERTNTWSNVNKIYLPSVVDLLKFTDFYKNLKNKDDWEIEYYTKIKEILTSGEIDACNNANECRSILKSSGYGELLLPEWITINLHSTGSCDNVYGYWTTTPKYYDSTSRPDFPCVWVTNLVGIFSNIPTVNFVDSLVSIRPIITITNNNVLEKLTEPNYITEEKCDFPIE